MEPYSQRSHRRNRASHSRAARRAAAGRTAAEPPSQRGIPRLWARVALGALCTVFALVLASWLLNLPAVAQETAGVPPAIPAADPAPAAASTDPRLAPPDWAVIGGSLGLMLLLLALYALFSMAETALVTVRRSRVEQIVEEGKRGAQTLRNLTDDPPRYIATIQVGITLLGFAAAAVAVISLARPLVPALVGWGLSVGYAETGAIALVTIAVALLAMILGEIAPKSLAVQQADVWALRLAPFVSFWSVVFKPLTAIVLGLSNVLVRPFGAKAQFETPMITKEELEHIMDQGASQGEFDREEREIITNVIDFSETLVRSVMTPRIDMTTLPITADLGQTVEIILKSGHSRIPVYEGTIDNVVGILHAKDLLPIFQGEVSAVDLRQVMRAAHFVPETKRVADLLAEMRRSNQQIAIVQDEYAGTEGLVSIEDLIEEIVGEIRDEYDVDEPDVQVVSESESVIDGRMSIDDVNDRLGVDLPHEDYETVGGLIFGSLGHEPEVGERVRIDGYEFVIERMEGTRIREVRAIRIDAADEDAPAGGGESVPAAV